MNEHGDILSKLLEAGLGYVWFVILAIWGGTVNYLSRIRQGKVEAFSFAELVGEWTVSGFAGLLTAFICMEMDFSWHLTAFFTGVSGHLGGRAIYMFEGYVKSHFPIIDKEVKKQRKNGNDDVR